MPGREFAIGAVGKMWKLSGGLVPLIRGAEDFVGFATPGYAKAAMSFSARSVGDRCQLVTETRVLATDEESRRAFGHYWLFIHPASATIRRTWLQAASRRLAEPGRSR